MENQDKVLAAAMETAQSQAVNRLDTHHKLSLFDKIEVRIRYNRIRHTTVAYATGYSNITTGSDEINVGE